MVANKVVRNYYILPCCLLLLNLFLNVLSGGTGRRLWR